MNENNKQTVQELEKIKRDITKKHPHMKMPDGQAIDKSIVQGTMHKVEKREDEPIKTGSLKPRTSIFEPAPVPVRLPSGKLVIDPNVLTPNNEVFVRRMTAIEENMVLKLAGINDPALINKSIDMIIDSCFKTNFDSRKLLLIDKFALFLKIISITYGPIDTTLSCPSCDTVYSKYPIDVYNDFEVSYVPDDYLYPHPLKVESYDECDLTWYLTYPTIGDTQELFQETQSSEEIPQLYVTDRIDGWIAEADGSKRQVQQSDYRPLITNLDKNDRKKYKKFMDEFSRFGLNMTTFKPFCTNKKCKLFEVGQEVSVPVEEIFTTIMSQYTSVDKESE